MNVAVYGYGFVGENLVHSIINEAHGINITCVIDESRCNTDHPVVCGEEVINIVSLNEFRHRYLCATDRVVIAIMDDKVKQDVAITLLCNDIRNVYLIDSIAAAAGLPFVDEKGRLHHIIPVDEALPVLDYVEYHLADTCNLNCKGCGHFSNKISNPCFPSIDEFKEAVSALHNLFSNILKFRFLGGEPLLNKDIGLFIDCYRGIFPDSEIEIVTNGLLAEKMSRETVDILYRCNVKLHVSQYPPTRKMADEIIRFCRDNRLRLEMTESIDYFFEKRYGEDSYFTYVDAWNACESNHCHFLRGKYLYPCPLLGMGEAYRQYASDVLVKKDEFDRYRFDLVDGKMSGWDILCLMERPFELCKICNPQKIWFRWENARERVKNG